MPPTAPELLVAPAALTASVWRHPVVCPEADHAAPVADPLAGLRVAVLIPCYNEEVAIGPVVAAFRAALPDAVIYVYDNNSSDGTVAAARAAGALVRREALQGKGHVVRRMFADVEADVYLLVDGDNTYDASASPAMARMLVADQLDMVTGTRVTEIAAAYRPGHRFGNVMLTGIVGWVFGDRITDMLSGYRVFSRRFVKIISRPGHRLRDGNRVHGSRARTEDADRRDGDALP